MLTILFFIFRIDMNEIIFLIFNLKTFFKKYSRLLRIISYSKFGEISFSFVLEFDKYRVLKITYFQLRKL